MSLLDLVPDLRPQLLHLEHGVRRAVLPRVLPDWLRRGAGKDPEILPLHDAHEAVVVLGKKREKDLVVKQSCKRMAFGARLLHT